MKSVVLCLFLLYILTGCSKDFTEHVESENINKCSGIVLQPRNQGLPKVWSKKQSSVITRSVSGTVPIDQYVGRGYRIGNGVIGDKDNLGFFVVDFEKLKKVHPTYLSSDVVREFSSAYFAYSNEDRYEELTTLTKKIEKNFNLNLVIFKIKRKKTITEKFVQQITSEDRSVFGEVEIEVRHKQHGLQATSTARKRIAANFLHGDFLEALYNGPLQELIDEFGLFVITRYYTGGRAFAMYYGVSNTFKAMVARERDMNKVIDASIKLKSNTDIASGLEVGKLNEDENKNLIERTFESVFYTIHSQGGAYGTEVNTSIKNIGNATDLSMWIKSLNDESTHVLTGFMDEGLRPVSDFILEENFRQRINDTHMGYFVSTELTEPFIEIMKVYVRTAGGQALCKVAPVLHTRQGDLLILSDSLNQVTDSDLLANNNNNTFMERANMIAAAKARYYQCRIEANPSKILNLEQRVSLNFDISKMSESRMYKFKNTETNMWYIYDPVEKIAYSYYFDDYILEAYGMLDWINSIPEKSISMTSLYQFYRIMGL